MHGLTTVGESWLIPHREEAETWHSARQTSCLLGEATRRGIGLSFLVAFS